MRKDISKEFKSSISVYVYRFVQSICHFFLSIYVVRYLTKADYGAYKLIGSISFVVVYLSSFGLERVIMRYVPEYLEKKSYRKVNTLIIISLLIKVTSLAIFVLVTNIFKNLFFSFLNLPEVLSTWYLIICLIIFLNLTKSVFGVALLSAYIEQYYVGINQIIYSVLQLFLFLGVVYLDYGLAGLILSMLISEVVSFSLYLVSSGRKILNNKRLSLLGGENNFEKINYKRISRFGLFSFLVIAVFSFVDTSIDNLVISHYYNSDRVAAYGFAASLVMMIASLAPGSCLRNVFNPIFIKRYTNTKNAGDLIFGFDFIIKIDLFIMLPVFTGLFLLSDKVVTYVYDSQYLDTIPIINILICFFLFKELIYAFDPLINVLEKNELFLISGIFSIYNLVMDIVLVPRYGIIGAAIATGSTGVLLYIYYWLASLFYIKLKLRFPFMSVFKVILNVLPMIGFILLTKHYITSIPTLSIIIASSAAIYATVSYFNKPFSQRDRNLINKAIGKEMFVF